MVRPQPEPKFEQCSKLMCTAPPRLFAPPTKTFVWATTRQMPHLPTYVAPYGLPLVPDTTRVTPDRLLGGNFPLNHHPHNTGPSLNVRVSWERLVSQTFDLPKFGQNAADIRVWGFKRVVVNINVHLRRASGLDNTLVSPNIQRSLLSILTFCSGDESEARKLPPGRN